MKEQLQKRIDELMVERSSTLAYLNKLNGGIEECQRLLEILNLEELNKKPNES